MEFPDALRAEAMTEGRVPAAALFKPRCRWPMPRTLRSSMRIVAIACMLYLRSGIFAITWSAVHAEWLGHDSGFCAAGTRSGRGVVSPECGAAGASGPNWPRSSLTSQGTPLHIVAEMNNLSQTEYPSRYTVTTQSAPLLLLEKPAARARTACAGPFLFFSRTAGIQRRTPGASSGRPRARHARYNSRSPCSFEPGANMSPRMPDRHARRRLPSEPRDCHSRR